MKRASQCPPLHRGSSSIALNIMDALKLTKCGKYSQSNLAIVDFKSIDVCEVHYLPSIFGSDVKYVLPPLPYGVPTTYGCGG